MVEHKGCFFATFAVQNVVDPFVEGSSNIANVQLIELLAEVVSKGLLQVGLGEGFLFQLAHELESIIRNFVG